MARHSTHSHANASDLRHKNPGRPSDEERGVSQRSKDLEPPEHVATTRVRVWVEGDVIIPEWDEEALLMKDDKLPELMRRLGAHADKTICSGFLVRVQSVPIEGFIPSKKYARRTTKRYTADDVLDYMNNHQGRTITDITKALFPQYPEPKYLEPRIRMALNRLQHQGKVESRKSSGKDARWYTLEKWTPSWSKRAEALAREIAKVRGGDAIDYEQEAVALEKIIEVNAAHPLAPDKWTHPDDSPF